MPKASHNIVPGDRFGKLVVQGPGDKDRYRQATVRCLCDCGRLRDCKASELRKGLAVTCARCPKPQHQNNKAAVRAAKTTHGATGTTEWHIWSGIRRRCLDPKDKAFDRYGGRGITVCPEWAASFEAFLRDMGARPSKRHTIERRNNNEGYGKANCYWATWEQQNRNRRTVLVDPASGRPLIEIAQERGLNWPIVRERISKRGWTIDRAMAEPKRPYSGGTKP